RIVRAVEALAKDDISRTLGRQLLRAGTSVGANYRAAVRARSHADFIAKLGIVEEECDETAYWMEVIAALKLLKKTRLERLGREARAGATRLRRGKHGVRVCLSSRCLARRTGAKHHHRHDTDSVQNREAELHDYRCARSQGVFKKHDHRCFERGRGRARDRCQ